MNPAAGATHSRFSFVTDPPEYPPPPDQPPPGYEPAPGLPPPAPPPSRPPPMYGSAPDYKTPAYGYPPVHGKYAVSRSVWVVIAAVIVVVALVVGLIGYVLAGYAYASSRITAADVAVNGVNAHRSFVN